MIIIYIAIAIAIIMIGGSIAMTIPKTITTVQPIAEGTADMISYSGVAIVVIVLLCSIILIFKNSKRGGDEEHE
jgi:heme/copper-type cytochrome/quinol oxidase subunit 2